MEFLEHHPVADHMLDIVGHHGEDVGDELGAKTAVAHRRKGSRGGRRCARRGRRGFGHEIGNILTAMNVRGAGRKTFPYSADHARAQDNASAADVCAARWDLRWSDWHNQDGAASGLACYGGPLLVRSERIAL